MANKPDLSEKTAIVAGAGRGLGRAAAEELAACGANVVVNDLGVSSDGTGEDPGPADQTVQNIVDGGGSAFAHFGDIADVEYCEELISDTVEKFNRVDIVANFAGILRDDYLVNMSESDWDEVIKVHLKGHFALIRAAGRHWRERYEKRDGFTDEKSFISVSSAASRGNPGQINYSSAKAGVLGLTRTGAREMERYDVRVNALMPVAMTRLVKRIPDSKLPDVDPEETGPERVAPMVAFLGSEAAEGITGCTFAAGGDGLVYVSDPDLQRIGFREGGWSAASIEQNFIPLLEDVNLSKTSPGGLLERLGK